MSEKIAKYLTPIVALFFATALGVTASSTIGTDISTGGNLDVTGNTTLTGTLDVTGATTLDVLTASTTAAGSDLTLKAMDDVAFTGKDFLFTGLPAGGGNFQVEMTGLNSADSNLFMEGGGNIYFWGDDSGGQFFNADFAPSGISMRVGAGYEFTLSDGYIDLSGITTIDPAGGTDEIVVDNGITTFTGRVKLPTAATPPVACAAGTVAQVYYDTTINELCYCNASAWTAFDGAGDCS